MTKKKVCPLLKGPYVAWCISNWGHPWGVERTRREAIEYAEDQTGKPWKECRRYCRVQKVKVTPL